MTTYTFHHDDGHGWLEVPYQDMMNVGVTLADVSRFSYATVVNYRPKSAPTHTTARASGSTALR
jgi:hypothetical protein